MKCHSDWPEAVTVGDDDSPSNPVSSIETPCETISDNIQGPTCP